jgi:hypothetical protein
MRLQSGQRVDLCHLRLVGLGFGMGGGGRLGDEQGFGSDVFVML